MKKKFNHVLNGRFDEENVKIRDYVKKKKKKNSQTLAIA